MPRERKGANKFKDADLDNPAVGPGGDMKLQPGSPSTKKRRTPAQASPSIPDLVPPPPMTGYGETIVASNPFDDTVPSQQTHLHHRPPQHAMLHQSASVNQPPQMSAASVMPPSAMHPKPMPMMSGKIYPHDQPMVFNPQNPNAPPIYPCGVCHKEVHDNDQAILCESGCNFWFHRICTGLTDAAFHLLTQEVYAEWVCDRCLSSKSIPLVKFKP
uniref:Putative pygopus 2 n=1 Tax=Ixodes ricinus TaxID=34613 RepID=V5HDF4_IXORI